MAKTWYMMAMASGAASARIDIYDEIGGWGISAKQFAESLAALGDVGELDIHIHSPGGDVFDGTAIYNLLKQHKARKVVTVDGLAASMASVIAMAGDTIRMPENALMMIHNPWMWTGGSAEELRKNADLLDKMAGQLRGAYVAKSGKTDDEIKAIMDAETWLTGSEAKAAGLADEVLDAVAVAAKLDLSKLGAKIDARAAAMAKTEEEIAHERNEGDADAEPVQGKEHVADSEADVVVPMVRHNAEVAAARAAGRDERNAELSGELNALQDRIAALTAERDALAAKVEAQSAEMAEAGNVLAAVRADLEREQATRIKLLAGMQYTAELTWPEALAKCGGDYAKARSAYPSAYKAYMDRAVKSEKNRKGT